MVSRDSLYCNCHHFHRCLLCLSCFLVSGKAFQHATQFLQNVCISGLMLESVSRGAIAYRYFVLILAAPLVRWTFPVSAMLPCRWPKHDFLNLNTSFLFDRCFSLGFVHSGICHSLQLLVTLHWWVKLRPASFEFELILTRPLFNF